GERVAELRRLAQRARDVHPHLRDSEDRRRAGPKIGEGGAGTSPVSHAQKGAHAPRPDGDVFELLVRHAEQLIEDRERPLRLASSLVEVGKPTQRSWVPRLGAEDLFELGTRVLQARQTLFEDGGAPEAYGTQLVPLLGEVACGE